jgi:4Fe-4S ferredoxin
MADARVPMSDCKEAAQLVPVVDRARCEAKGDCIRVCPYDVFELRELGSADKAALSLLARLKARVHGNRQAFVARPADCHACGECVTACPERAIKLVRSTMT